MNNLDLWNKLEKTDPSRTKQFSRTGGFKGTAINATYIKKRLTEAFGPCGKGWRFVLEEERIIEGPKLESGDLSQLHVVRGHLEYRDADTDKWYQTSPQFGQTMLVGEHGNPKWTYFDEEAPKKSITDCTTKCAVDLGLAADIHLGLYDDNRYVNDLRNEEKKTKLEQAAAKNPLPKSNGTPKPFKDVVTAAQEKFEQCSNLADAKRAMLEIYTKMADKKFAPEKVKECVMQFEWLRERFQADEMAELEKNAERLTAQLEEAVTV